ncbi:MAG: ATP-binding protein [Acidimicrobiaceae bacterium]|nr:ATP-binding protein [Acidimicrobiaceae bacterium]
MIKREITPYLTTLFEQYPFVTVTGPRQSGKTTLCRTTFPDLAYTNLETPDVREFAESDPQRFLSQLGTGAIIDEIQRVPLLLSYLQVLADEIGRDSLFVLTGSEQFGLTDTISQSLAGRTALLHLLPFSLDERHRAGATDTEVDDIIYSGFYPRIHDRGLEPRQMLRDYFETYVERDVRQMGGIRNLSGFRLFVRLCAGRVGQLFNLSSLGSDVGISHTTAQAWMTILERSYVVFRLRPFHTNIRKRLVKSPKLYFHDVGLACYLIGIEHAEQLTTHPLRGPLFENLVVAETLKHRFNQGRRSNLSFFRDSKGLECDLLYEVGSTVGAIEIKAGSTVASDYFRSLDNVAELVTEISTKAVVYGGSTLQSRSQGDIIPLTHLRELLRRLDTEATPNRKRC